MSAKLYRILRKPMARILGRRWRTIYLFLTAPGCLFEWAHHRKGDTTPFDIANRRWHRKAICSLRTWRRRQQWFHQPP